MSDWHNAQIAQLSERLIATQEQREEQAKFAFQMLRERDAARFEARVARNERDSAHEGWDVNHKLASQYAEERNTARAERDRLAACVERVRGCERVECVVDWGNEIQFEEPQTNGPYMRAADIFAALEGA